MEVIETIEEIEYEGLSSNAGLGVRATAVFAHEGSLVLTRTSQVSMAAGALVSVAFAERVGSGKGQRVRLCGNVGADR